jgi:RHS repeat-associated protein
MHTDSLGSIDTITDSVANVVEYLSYEPFGNRRESNWRTTQIGTNLIPKFTKLGFTGHEHIDEFNLIHMNGRVYDPVIGRFISADPVIQSPFESQNFNRYTYVMNNPLKYTDPSGFVAKGENDESAYNAGYFGGLVGWLSDVLIGSIKVGADGGKIIRNSVIDTAALFSPVALDSYKSGYYYDSSKYVALAASSLLPSKKVGAAKNTLKTAADTAYDVVTKSVDSNSIRFSQSSVNGAGELTKSMRANGWKGDAIDVVKMGDGGLTTLDNTRVLAASRAGVNVQANVRNASDALPANMVERFTTKKGVPTTWGEAAQLRIGKQSAGWRNGNSNGSMFTRSDN